MTSTKILFVCMGNICRSPTAEGVFARMVAARGLGGRVVVDSAGTHGYHVGAAPDRRSQLAARARGYDIGGLRARAVEPLDFERFDLLLAMDEDNLAALKAQCPEAHLHKVRLFMEFDTTGGPREVPDPYYGGPEGFDRVLDLVEAASLGLLETLAPR